MKLRAFVILKKDENILLIKESNLKWKNKWYFPGGKVKKTETPLQAAIRETKEESGFDVSVKGILFVNIISNGPDKGTRIYYSGEIISGTIKKNKDLNSMEACWHSLQEIQTLPFRDDLPEIIQKLKDDPQIIPERKINIKTY